MLGVSTPTTPAQSNVPGLPEDLSQLRECFGLSEDEDFFGSLWAPAAAIQQIGLHHLLNGVEPRLGVTACRALTALARAEPLSVEISTLLCTLNDLPEGAPSPGVSTTFDPKTGQVSDKSSSAGWWTGTASLRTIT
jgi:hypothetical protein